MEVMMKKALALILAGLLTLCAASCANKNEEEQNQESIAVEQNYIEEASKKGRFEYDRNEEGDYEIIGYESYSIDASDITLPSKIDEFDIVGIAKDAFKAENSIKSVTIPATYEYIGEFAFYDCDSLTTVKIPTSMSKIGKHAFDNCDSLSNINVPNTVKEIAEFTFKDCKVLKTLDLPGVTSIKTGAFFNCVALENITVSDKLNYATRDAFQNCVALVYTNSEGLLYLGNDTNANVLLVKPEDLNVIECTVAKNTKVIADAAFSDCDSLTSIILSDSVKVINGSAFAGCTELTYNRDENDKNGLYLGTKDNPYMVLIELEISTVEVFKLNKDTKIIADTAFAKCTNLKDIGFEGTEAEWGKITKSETWNGDLTLNIACSDKTVTVLG